MKIELGASSVVPFEVSDGALAITDAVVAQGSVARLCSTIDVIVAAAGTAEVPISLVEAETISQDLNVGGAGILIWLAVFGAGVQRYCNVRNATKE